MNRPSIQALFAFVRGGLRHRVFGYNEASRRLALAGAMALAGYPPRVVLLGDSGTKHLVRSLAEAMGAHLTRVGLMQLCETNWQGVSLPDLLRAAPAFQGSVVHLEGLDAVTVRDGVYRGTSDTTRDYQHGRQRSILPLLRGDPVPLDRDGTMFDSALVLVVTTASMPGIAVPAGTDEWQDQGLLPELAAVLATATQIRLGMLNPEEIELALLQAVLDLSIGDACGYDVAPDMSVVRRLAGLVADGQATLREAIAWLRSGMETGILSLLEAGAPPGTAWTLALDDLNLPVPSKGRWVE